MTVLDRYCQSSKRCRTVLNQDGLVRSCQIIFFTQKKNTCPTCLHLFGVTIERYGPVPCTAKKHIFLAVSYYTFSTASQKLVCSVPSVVSMLGSHEGPSSSMMFSPKGSTMSNFSVCFWGFLQLIGAFNCIILPVISHVISHILSHIL